MSTERFEAGLAVRREVLGAEYVDQAIAGADSFNREFQEFATEFCWGGTWARGVLERKTRSMLNLCMLSALNRPHEELKEVLLQITAYCGIPAGVEAFRLAREVLKEQGIEPGEAK
jgi:4-carboxymuconolactone decarboxylase